MPNKTESLKNNTAQENMSATIAKLRASNQALSSFATLCAHDLREPLRNISNLSYLLKKLSNGKGESDTLLCHIIQSCQRMQSLIEGMLTLSYFPHHSLRIESIDLNLLVNHILSDLECLIQNKKLTFHVSPLPVVRGYWVLYQQLFHNLINNVIKHSSQENNEASILMESTPEYWTFKIFSSTKLTRDPSELEDLNASFKEHKLFPSPNMGLGLFICKTIVDKMAGEIQIQPRSTSGVVVSVRIPKAFHLSPDPFSALS